MIGNPFFWASIAAITNATPNTTLASCLHELELELGQSRLRSKLARSSVEKLIHQLEREVDESIRCNGPINWDTSIGVMLVSELLPE